MTDPQRTIAPDARTLLEWIRPSSTFLEERGRGEPWMFRGQRDTTWDLLPALHRAGDNRDSTDRRKYWRSRAESHFGNKGDISIPASASNMDRKVVYTRLLDILAVLDAERDGVFSFTDLANDIGFPVGVWEPQTFGDSEVALEGWDGRKALPAPPTASRLAQHHGIRTRLLDWTRNPLIAAYFAAMDHAEHAARQKKNREAAQNISVAIWAVRWINVDWSSTIQLLRPTEQPNAYLAAQKGMFTYHATAESHYLKTGTWISHHALMRPFKTTNGPTVLKLELAGADVGQLLQLLEREGLTPAHLRPSLDQVADVIKSRFSSDE